MWFNDEMKVDKMWINNEMKAKRSQKVLRKKNK